MNKIKTFMLLALTALAVASCSKDDLPGSSGNVTPEGRGIYLSFSDGADTRSTLQSSEVDYHDVKAVYLYVFEGTDGNATCVYDLNVQWDQEGDISQKQWISVDLKDNETYTFLAVGVDDKAGEVYGFPKNMEGETLSNVVAAYTGTDKAAMATAQLFAGYEEATVTDGKATVEITLRRKVAGVLAYLKNIPYKVEDTQVTDLKIKLGRKQHTQMALWSDSDKEQFGTGELADDDQYLFEQKLDGTYEPDSEGRYYVIPAKTVEKDGVATLENSLLMGAFLLPIEAGSEPTLTLELWGNKLEGGTEPVYKVLKTYQITNDNETTFSIEENKLYSIGKKLSDASTDGDKPADLSGNILQLEVVEWCSQIMDNVFPNIVVPVSIKSNYNVSNYIFDAMSDTTTVYIRASEEFKNTQWTLDVSEYDWLHIIAQDETGQGVEYKKTLQGYGDKDVVIIFNDYAARRKNKDDYDSYKLSDEDKALIRNDYRSAEIKLYTAGQPKPYPLLLRQYNVINVYAYYDYVGISRLDYGCYFDRQTGREVRPNTNDVDKNQWGYYSTATSYVSGEYKMNYDDGEDTMNKVYQRYLDGSAGSAGWPGSIFQKVRTEERYIIDCVEQEPKHVWYVPAYHEMWAVSHVLANNSDMATVLNMKKGDNYWSSVGDETYVKRAYYMTVGVSSFKESADKNEKFFRVRPMRKLETDTKQ